MSLILKDFPNPYATDPFPYAIAWVNFVAIDFSSMTARIVVQVNADPEAALDHKPPVATLDVPLGQGGFPSLEALLEDNANALASIRTYLYQKLAQLPAFQGAIIVDDNSPYGTMGYLPTREGTQDQPLFYKANNA